MSKALWKWLAPLFLLPLGLFTLGCLDPTQIVVEIWTDVPCEQINSVAVFTGEPGKFESKAASSTGLQQSCRPATEPGAPAPSRLGTVVLVPSGEKTGEVGVKVAAGVGKNAENCVIPEGADVTDAVVRYDAFQNCVIARRSLHFQENETLKLPIVLRSSCKNIGCTSTTTCIYGECRPIGIGAEDTCKKPEGCTEQDVGTTLEPATGCGRPSVFSDRFGIGLKEGETYTPSIWTVVSGQEKYVGQSTGRLIFTPPPVGQGGVYYTTKYAVDFTEDRFRIQVPAVLDQSSDAAVVFKVQSVGGADWIKIEAKQGNLAFVASTDAMGDTITEPYNPKTDLWWEFLAVGNSIEMRTSPDGLEWNTRRSAPRPAFASVAKAAIGVEAPTSATPSPGTAQVAFFNTVRESLGWCKTSALVDEFDAMALSDNWTPQFSDMAYTPSVSGGALTLLMTGAQKISHMQYLSERAYDVTDSTLTLRLSNMTKLDIGTEVFISAQKEQGGKLRMAMTTSDGTTLSFCNIKQPKTGGAAAACATIGQQMGDEFMMRIQHAGDVLTWLVKGSAGPDWRELSKEVLTADDPEYSLKELQVSFGVETTKNYTPGTAPTVTIESINPAQ